MDFPKLINVYFIWKKTYSNVLKLNECFEQIYSVITLIYCAKTMVPWKKIWYYTKNHGIILRTAELSLAMKNIC